MSTPTVRYELDRGFDAPCEDGYKAWTDPERFVRWFGPRAYATPAERVHLDVRPGGRWEATLVSGDGFEVTLQGIFREVRVPERLVFTTGDPDGPASVVTVEFTTAGTGTHVRFHQYGVNTTQEHAEGARVGWIEFVDRLAEEVA
ncbi:SRPBCC family protein [Nonomuraea sediminis]|uniref:SRPBCC family protein n=1 Tax=Nonomuraea sediminis TaxID=2835864 RepID=UPI001BDD37EF|nr:SRPBCC domain-containing protein [Nonomuraea sediminis]